MTAVMDAAGLRDEVLEVVLEAVTSEMCRLGSLIQAQHSGTATYLTFLTKRVDKLEEALERAS